MNNALTSGTSACTRTAPNAITLSVPMSLACSGAHRAIPSFPTRRTSDLTQAAGSTVTSGAVTIIAADVDLQGTVNAGRSEERRVGKEWRERRGAEDERKKYKLTNTELNNVTTTGTGAVGPGTDTGGITIG